MYESVLFIHPLDMRDRKTLLRMNAKNCEIIGVFSKDLFIFPIQCLIYQILIIFQQKIMLIKLRGGLGIGIDRQNYAEPSD